MNKLNETAGDTFATVTVGLGKRSYRISIGSGTLPHLGDVCRKLCPGKRLAVVTNPTVGALYLEQVRNPLLESGLTVSVIEIPDGEEYKSLSTLSSVYEQLVGAGMDRGGCVVALGGGVVGDLAGFAAATFLRGISYIQVPTTLLAQVDSSVGGKTGVNLPHGKNLVGAFHQPLMVMIDVSTLVTLPEREYLGGLAEVIKYGIVLDKGLFNYIEGNVAEILQRDPVMLEKIIARCCTIKADVVGKDERETGLRAVLNYGHTFGHAVEALTLFSRYSHGEAVAIGMVVAARYSQLKGFSTQDKTARIVKLIERVGLPVSAPIFSVNDYSAALMRDKKARDTGVTFVCNKGIGDFSFVRIEDMQQLLTSAGIGG